MDLNIGWTIATMVMEVLCILYAFGSLEERESVSAKTAGWLFLCLFPVLYFVKLDPGASNIGISLLVVRTVFHFLVVAGFLYGTKNLPVSRVLLFASADLTINMTAQNLQLFLTAVFGKLSYPMILAEIASRIVLTVLFVRFCRIKEMRSFDRVTLMICILLNVMQQYFKWSLFQQRVIYDRTEFVLYTLAGILGGCAIMILSVSNDVTRQEKENAVHASLQAAYESANAKRALQYQNDIRKLHHDMKNHLVTIRNLSGNNEKMNEYLKDLMGQMQGYESNVRTGNPMVDSLLSAKIASVRDEGISFNIVLDLAGWSYLKETDITVIFGNAVDNAVEAVRKLPEGQEKMIYLKSRSFAGNTVVTFENPCIEEEITGGTSKADKKNHGIGLNSIRSSVKRYGGQVMTEKGEGVFRLSVMLANRLENRG